MSLSSALSNPLERLTVLPDAMNWRGVWNNTTQYYRNDVVLSPADTAAYIALTVSALGGGDPSVNPDWTVLSPATAGVLGITAGAGISIGGTPTLPVITNTGLLSATAGLGITNTGTTSDPIFENTGVLSLTVGTGLSSTGGSAPTIANTGVLSIVGGSGVTVVGSNIPTIANTGVVSLNVIAPGLTSTGGQTPTIANTGVQSITGGTGIVVSGPPNAPTLTLTAAGASPVLSLITNVTPSGVIANGATLGIGASPSPTSLLADHLLNGSPDPNGVWVLDLTGYTYYVAPPSGGTNTITLSIRDAVTPGSPFIYPGVSGTGVVDVDPNRPLYLSLGKFYLDVVACRALGFRVLTAVLVANDTGQQIFPTGSGAIPAYYYPNGIQ